jgi:hypothetical protein
VVPGPGVVQVLVADDLAVDDQRQALLRLKHQTIAGYDVDGT